MKGKFYRRYCILKCLLCGDLRTTSKYHDIDMCDDCYIRLKRKEADCDGYYQVGDKFLIQSISIVKSFDCGGSKMSRYANVIAAVKDQYNGTHMLSFDGEMLVVDKAYLDELKLCR